jgi:hypothetical protein
MDQIKMLIAAIVVGVIILLGVYAAYDLTARLAYYLWYDDMVIETIRKEVKSECLSNKEF